MQQVAHGVPSYQSDGVCTVSIDELLDRLRACDAEEFEVLCTALAKRVPHVSPADAPLLADALVSALQVHLGNSSDHAISALLDEVCGSWSSTRMLPEETLRSLLRVLLRGLNGGIHVSRSSDSGLHRSRSSPDIFRRPSRKPPTSAKRNSTSCMLEPKDSLPIGDVRLLQALLTMISHCDGNSPSAEELPAEASTPQRGGKAASEDAPTSPLQVPPALQLESLSPSARVKTDTPRVAEVHNMADGDSSECSEYQSEASIDWCCTRTGALPLDPPSPVPGLELRNLQMDTTKLVE